MRRRGFALVYQMLATMVIVVLIGALLTLSQFQVFSSQANHSALQAQYNAESGMATVMARLSDDPTWAGSYNHEAVGESGDFSFHFGTALGEFDSVNNLGAAAPKDSFLGPATVPPYTALIVVSGRHNGVQKTVEAFLVGGGDFLTDEAIASSGKIHLKGNVIVDGFQSMRKLATAVTGLHSNLGAGPKAIEWAADTGDVLRVACKLSAVSSDADAIDIGSSTVSKEINAPYKKLGRINITNLVANHASAPETLPPTGSHTLAAGDHYFSGAQELNGDLTLEDGANVYVNGNLKINGSISGQGSLVVNGNTKLYGDSEIMGDPNSYVSVISKGHVVISGYDGSAHLDALAAAEPANSSTPRGSEVGELWTDLKDNFAWYQDYLSAHPDVATWNDEEMDAHSNVLARGGPGWGGASFTNLPNAPAADSNALLRARLNDRVPTERFLKKRLQNVDDLLRSANETRTGPVPVPTDNNWGALRWNTVQAYLNGGWDPETMGGMFDCGQSLVATGSDSPLVDPAQRLVITDTFLTEMTRQIDQFNYSRIGAANFKGLIYAQGGVLAVDEVTVLGAIICNGDPTLPDYTEDGHNLKAGQVLLENSSRLTYIKDMFSSGAANLASLGVLGIKGWRLRP
jgi:hypothetical protein